MGNKESVFIGKGNKQTTVRPQTFKTAKTGQYQPRVQESVMVGGGAMPTGQAQSYPQESVMAGGAPTAFAGGPQKQHVQKMVAVGGETPNVLEYSPKPKQETEEVDIQQPIVKAAATPQTAHRDTVRKPAPSPHRPQEVPGESVFAAVGGGGANIGNQNQGIQQSVFVGDAPQAKEVPSPTSRPKPSTQRREKPKSPSAAPQPVFYMEVQPKPANIPKPGTPVERAHQQQKPAETKPVNETAMNPEKLLYPTFRPQLMQKSDHEDDDKDKHKQHKTKK